ncbi:hypothetical protein [Brachybacterium sp. GPGPB12]|uniref:hypothetical protein n=1 Tax=Brachybacterium sp. GPGPB12 TaxID=3023517 RepID=UPI0031345537
MSGYDPEEPPVQEPPWVLPSPNIPTPDTAVVYAGTGLIESLNISEGRGTTTPFLWFGAPFITEEHVDQLLETLRAAELPGVLYRPMFATPTTSKHAGVFCGGLQAARHRCRRLRARPHRHPRDRRAAAHGGGGRLARGR